jgi:class 3 adenylate cyclase
MDKRTGYAKTPEGAHLAYSVMGTGPVDMLSISPWTVSIDSLDDDPRVAQYFRRIASFSRLIRYDMRGIGLSDPLDSRTPFDVAQGARDAAAVLDAIGAKQVVLLADNGGAVVAVRLVHERPDLAAALIFINAYARLVADDDYPIGHPREVVDFFLNANPDPDQQWDIDGADDLHMIVPSLADDATFRDWWVRAARRGASPATARALLVANSLCDERALLPDLDLRCLVLHARRNRFIPIRLGRYLAEHIANAKFVEIDSADSAVWGDARDAILDEIEEFVTGQRAGNVDRVLATLLFTDIVDSTGRAVALGDVAWRALLDRHDGIVRAEIRRFGGREVNTTGDGFLGAFDAPTQAVRCAAAIVAATAAEGIAVRAGVHTGEAERRGNDLAGLTVHIAARVAAAAASGEVLVSRTVRDLVAGSELALVDKGMHDLKGVSEPWQLFALEA